MQSTKRQENVTVVMYNQDEINQISDYMVANILACLCCCWCIGCVAIMKSNECKEAKRAGNVGAAQRYSESARKHLIATIVVGIITGIIVGIILYATRGRAAYY